MRRLKSGIACAMALLAASTSYGQTNGKVPSGLNQRLAHHLLIILDYKSFASNVSAAAETAFPPGTACHSLWMQVINSQLAKAEPLFMEVVTGAVPQTFTAAEIKTGVLLFDGPAGELARLGKQNPRPRVDPALMAAAEKQIRETPRAEEFEDKVENPNALSANVAREFANRFGPIASMDFAKRSRAAGIKCRPT